MKKFKLLVLSGDLPDGYPIAAGQSFVEQLTRRIAREGLELTVDRHAGLSLTRMNGLLPRLPLQHYDLIVLQPGYGELQRPASFWTLFVARPEEHVPANRLKKARKPGFRLLRQVSDVAGIAALRVVTRLAVLPRLYQIRHELRTVLDGLQPCGHNVVLITPFPHGDAVTNWLRKTGRRLFLEEGYRAFMPVFDAYSLLDVGDVCFFSDEQTNLNPLGHELLGSALYDYFRAGVSVVGDSSSYRRHE